MSQVSELIEAQERLYSLRDKIAARPVAERIAAKSKLAAANDRLNQIEAGLYPTCEVCKERIEMQRLLADPMTATCQVWAAHAARTLP